MVDDDTDDQQIFSLAIQAIDPTLSVVFATNGGDALKQLQDMARPDVIFLDYQMPGMDGIECLTKLKAVRSTRQIPVIMYTGSDSKAEKQLAIRLGAFEFMGKSKHVDQLTSEIGKIISLLNKV